LHNSRKLKKKKKYFQGKVVLYVSEICRYVDQGYPDLVTSEANFIKNLENSMKTQFIHFNWPLKFSWTIWNIVSKLIKEISEFPTFPGKIEV
jgi:hypothetical protein